MKDYSLILMLDILLPEETKHFKKVHDRETRSMYYIYLKNMINIIEIGLFSLLLITHTTWHGVFNVNMYFLLGPD